MTGVTGLPASVIPPSVGGDPASAAARRPAAEPVREEDAAAKGGKGAAMDREGLEKMVKDANQSLSAMTSLRISLDRESNRMVVQVVDKSNHDKVIRQIPNENVMDLAKRIDALKELKGFFLDTKA